MKTLYLLPCTCGEKLTVDRSQAGLSVRCHCGADVTIPTLRGFEKLERAEESAGVPAHEWGPRQAVIFLGGMITAVALLAVAGLWLSAPTFPKARYQAMLEEASSTQDLDQLTIDQLFRVWQQLERGTMGNLEYATLRAQFDFAAQINQQRTRVATAALIVGAATLVVGLLIPRRARRKAAGA